MNQLIPFLNQLHDVLRPLGNSVEVDLPIIAIVGAQSVGKSSVLEALVGHDFLPRGWGLVTKCPIFVQLRTLTNGDDFGQFDHRPDVKFTYEGIKAEIDNQMNHLTGQNPKAITSTPIVLKIFSRNVIDLTLIDLPGLLKLPTNDQPYDIEVQVRDIILNFISKPNCIILAVSAANTDLAVSDGLQLARSVDPFGVRTIGVITKCDLLDEGKDAYEMLQGHFFKLQRGYVGVVCRSQNQLKNISIEESLEKESNFFKTECAFSSLQHKCGTPYLATLLNQTLLDYIKKTLPDIRSQLQTLLKQNRSNLSAVSDPLLDLKGNPAALILQLCFKFSRQFEDSINGKSICYNTTIQLNGGARLRFIFHDWFGKALLDFHPLQGLTDKEIVATLRNAAGPSSALFVPEGAFEILVRKQIRQLELPSMQCVELVYEELQCILQKCGVAELSRFYNLQTKILEESTALLKRCLSPTVRMIDSILQVEQAYINKNHPDLLTRNTIQDCLKSSRCIDPMHSNTLLNSLNMDENTKDFQKNEYEKSKLGKERNNDSKARTSSYKDTPTTPHKGFFSFLKNVRYTFSGETEFSASTQYYDHLESLSDENLPDDTTAPLNQKTSSSPTFPRLISLKSIPDSITPGDDISEREGFETQLLKSLICAYFSIVRKKIADSVPKAIMCFLVNAVKSVLYSELVSRLYKEDQYQDLLKEGSESIAYRTRCKENVRFLEKALKLFSNLNQHYDIQN